MHRAGFFFLMGSRQPGWTKRGTGRILLLVLSVIQSEATFLFSLLGWVVCVVGDYEARTVSGHYVS